LGGALQVVDRLKENRSWSPLLRRVEVRYDGLAGERVPVVVPVALPSAVADAAPGMFGLQVAEHMGAPSMPTDDVAAMKRQQIDLAPAVDADPVRRIVGNASAASGARSALRSDDGTVPHILGVTVPPHPVRPVDETHAADLSGIPRSLNADP
jgi:hypothetical protein